MPAMAQAQLTFTTNNGAITITGCAGNPTIINIPDMTNGFPVVSIANNAFLNRSTLTSITIPNSVTSIGSQAFSTCRALTSIAIPNSVTNLGDRTFNSCTGLTNIIIGSGISAIGQYPLAGCTNLISATVGIPSIGMYLFYSPSNPNNPFPNLTSITLLDTVTNISPYAFITCQSVTNLKIGSGVTTIGTGAFQGMQALKALTVATNNLDSVSNWT